MTLQGVLEIMKRPLSEVFDDLSQEIHRRMNTEEIKFVGDLLPIPPNSCARSSGMQQWTH
jgi:hypothetical protein